MLQFTTQQIQKFQQYLKIKPNLGAREISLIEKTQQLTWLFRLCPGIELLAVGNSVAMGNAHTGSDIDLFIVTQKNRLWYVRVFLTVVLGVLGKRKNKRTHAGTFCLSFFMTNENLSLEKIAVENDIYLFYWMLSLKPIVNNDQTYEKFIKQNATWCALSMYPHAIETNKNFITYSGGTWGTTWKLLDLKNWGYKKIFLPKTLRSFEKLGRPYGVVISDTMLKFHDKDKRKEIRDAVLYS